MADTTVSFSEVTLGFRAQGDLALSRTERRRERRLARAKSNVRQQLCLMDSMIEVGDMLEDGNMLGLYCGLLTCLEPVEVDRLLFSSPWQEGKKP